MSEILGYDCNGKALRAGDRCVIIRVTERWEHVMGRQVSILGACPVADGFVEVDVPAQNPHWDWASIQPDWVQRIDDQERGDWSEIEKATGWNPEAVPA